MVRPDSLSKIASRLDCQLEASVFSAGIFLRNDVSTGEADNLATWILAESRVAPEVVLIGQTGLANRYPSSLLRLVGFTTEYCNGRIAATTRPTINDRAFPPSAR